MNDHPVSRFNLAQSLLDPNLERHPDKIAYFCQDEEVSYRQLADAARRVAALLQARDIETGDRVLLVLQDSPVFIASLLGVMLVGGVAVIAGTSLTSEDYRFIQEDSGAQMLFASASLPEATALAGPSLPCLRCGESLAEWLTRLPGVSVSSVPRSGDDDVLMLYTSGSTGRPKGVPHSANDVQASAEAFAGGVLAMTSEDVVFSVSKLFFAYGLGNSFTFPLRFGATAVLHPAKPEPAEIRRLITNHRVSLFFAVPVVYTMLLKTMPPDWRPETLRLCVSAGEALPAPVAREWHAQTGIELLDGIGSTEVTHIYIAQRPGESQPGATGRLIPPYETRIVDEAGAELADGSPGTMHVRGPSLARRYWKRPEKTAATMLADGWLNTGDIFRRDDGWYYYLGRHDDMFKVDAQWVSPLKIEEVLREHPAVLDCGVTWRSLEGLNHPLAFVVPGEGQNPDPALDRELRQFAAQQLPSHMVPVQIEFIAELPKTATGKVQRFRLRELFTERSAS
ncbi:MAG: hypothetical protein BWK76_17570 [Desulfobulbaceae bacterium A2]|nr:MAG: hypothetical protein BWK76_17570 [Desulfobulbaceae bacterium A2]